MPLDIAPGHRPAPFGFSTNALFLSWLLRDNLRDAPGECRASIRGADR